MRTSPRGVDIKRRSVNNLIYNADKKEIGLTHSRLQAGFKTLKKYPSKNPAVRDR
jgi:hypothetical protein